jgi:thymidylate kinase
MIVGPDGTGKTSLCNALVEQISLRSPVRVLANRSGATRAGLLPRRKPRGSKLEPHRHPDHSRLLSIAKSLYYLVDFYLGWLVRVRPFVRRGGWVLVERGWWDVLVDPRRYRLDLPQWLRRSLAHLMPRPSLVFVLGAPPEVIIARKPQLPEAELVRQMDAWQEILPRGQARLHLDTSGPREEAVQAASRAVDDLISGGAPPAGGRHEALQPSRERPVHEHAQTPPAASAWGTRGLLWLPLLQRLTQLSPSSVVWKNASSALEGRGDLDVVSPPEDWEAIEAAFRRWARAESLHPVAVCRHVPGAIFLLAVDPERPAFFELDIKARGAIRGTTVFRPRDLQPLSDLDPRGFRRLRPGAEGLLKLMMNCIRDDGGLNHDRLNRERVAELLQADPVGVRAAAGLFGSNGSRVVQLTADLLRGDWHPRRGRMLRARLRLGLILDPASVVQRVRMRTRQAWVGRAGDCPGVRALINQGRLLPGDVRGVQRIVRAHVAPSDMGSV